MSKKRELIKAGSGLVVGIGVSAIAGGAVGLVRPQNVGKIKNFCIGVGGLILASMVSDQAVQYTDDKIDEVGDAIKAFLGTDDEPETEVS